MTLTELLQQARAWWRVPLVALLGGLLAFGGSYAFAPTYQASTRLLIRAQDSTLLDSSGQSVSEQPAVVDPSLATSLGDTQSALLGSTTVAEQVVDTLRLDHRRTSSGGLLGPVKSFVSGTVARARAYVTHGYYARPSKHDAAVTDVQNGLSATPLKSSYVLKVTGSADEAQLAADVTNTAADALVNLSNQRFRTEALRSRDFLAGQVTKAEQDLGAATTAQQAFEQAHGFSDLPADLALDRTSRDALATRLSSTTVDLRAARAQLATAQQSLDAAPVSTSGKSEIVTGRSTTQVLTSGSSSVHDALVVERDRLSALVSSLSAAQTALQGQVDGSSLDLTPEDQSTYDQLDQRVTALTAAFQSVTKQQQDAQLTADRAASEVTRIDTATAPTFPVGPLRYIYLALGLLCGALAGWALTWLSGRRERVLAEEELAPGDEDDDDLVPLSDLLVQRGPTAPAGIDLTSAPGERGRHPLHQGAAGNGAGSADGAVRLAAGRFEVYRTDPDTPSGPS